MSSARKLSSYFSRRRDIRPPDEEEHKPTTSVRARLEKKLQIRQKTSFAFNFTVDSDTDDLQGREKGSFCFDFKLSDTTNDGEGERESKGRGSGEGHIPRAAQDFVVEVEGRSAGSIPKKKSKKNGAGKKKKGAKKKGKLAERGIVRDLTGEQQPQQDLAPKSPSSSPIGDGVGQTTCFCLPLAVESNSKPTHDDMRQGSAIGEKASSETLRPPPGFTLESWKDPALSVEERRRRRFGHGVRNMVAIQRSSDARRGVVVAGESEPQEFLGRHGNLVRPGRDRAHGHGPVQDAVPGDAVGGPSVFSFGFDIGISFDGGGN